MTMICARLFYCFNQIYNVNEYDTVITVKTYITISLEVSRVRRLIFYIIYVQQHAKIQ